MAPEQFRGSGCAQATSCSPQSGTVFWRRWDCWGGWDQLHHVGSVYTSDSHPKTGRWELLSSLDCSMSPGDVWDVAVSAAVRNTMEVAYTVKKSGHPCFNCFTIFGSYVKCLCTAWCGVVKTCSPFLGSCWFFFECCWTKHASVVTDPLFNTKLSSVLARYCLYLLPSCSQALGTNGTDPRRFKKL